MLTSIIAVLFTFGLVIFLHELGHFIVCKLSGIRVEAFSFGFGPELFGRTSGPTRYSIRAIPLGGYVKPAGEEIDQVSGSPDEYFAKPWYVRLGVVFAGLLFGALKASRRTMVTMANTPDKLTDLIQALVVLFVAAPAFVVWLLPFLKERKVKKETAPIAKAAQA